MTVSFRIAWYTTTTCELKIFLVFFAILESIFSKWPGSILCIFNSHIYWMVKTTQVIHRRSSCSDLSFHSYFGLLSTFQNRHFHLTQISNGSPAGDSSGWSDCLKVLNTREEKSEGVTFEACRLLMFVFMFPSFSLVLTHMSDALKYPPPPIPTNTNPAPPTPTLPHPQPHGSWRRNGAETCGGSEVQRWTSKPQKKTNNNTRDEDVRRWLMEVEEPWSVSRLKTCGAKLHQSRETWNTPAVTCSCWKQDPWGGGLVDLGRVLV